MFHARIQARATADEPAESRWRTWAREIWGSDAAHERVRKAFGEQTLERLGAVGSALETAGLGDAVHVFADQRALYVDPGETPADLSKALAATGESKALDRDFSTLRLVCSAVEDAVHVLADVQIAGRRHEKDGWLEVAIAARPRSLFVRPGDGAEDYRRRVVEEIRREGSLEEKLETVDGKTTGLRDALAQTLPGHALEAAPTTARLIRTGPKQVGRFRNLGFGSSVRPPTYRAEPTHRRDGAYDSPFFYYYFDPYQDLLHWIIVEDMFQHGTWGSPRVEVVDRTGAVLFRGDEASAHANDRFEVPRGAVRFQDGTLHVDDAVPRESSMDRVEIGSPFTPGFGGEGEG
jgi:hypothetical protein